MPGACTNIVALGKRCGKQPVVRTDNLPAFGGALHLCASCVSIIDAQRNRWRRVVTAARKPR